MSRFLPFWKKLSKYWAKRHGSVADICDGSGAYVLAYQYDRLHMMANYDILMRQLMGIETLTGYEKITFEYQDILDNVSLLDDETVKKLNEVIIFFGHHVFKKKEQAPMKGPIKKEYCGKSAHKQVAIRAFCSQYNRMKVRVEPYRKRDEEA